MGFALLTGFHLNSSMVQVDGLHGSRFRIVLVGVLVINLMILTSVMPVADSYPHSDVSSSLGRVSRHSLGGPFTGFSTIRFRYLGLLSMRLRVFVGDVILVTRLRVLLRNLDLLTNFNTARRTAVKVTGVRLCTGLLAVYGHLVQIRRFPSLLDTTIHYTNYE